MCPSKLVVEYTSETVTNHLNPEHNSGEGVWGLRYSYSESSAKESIGVEVVTVANNNVVVAHTTSKVSVEEKEATALCG